MYYVKPKGIVDANPAGCEWGSEYDGIVDGCVLLLELTPHRDVLEGGRGGGGGGRGAERKERKK